MKLRTLALLALVIVGACHRPPDSAFLNRGGPASLLDVSSEIVNLSIAGPAEMKQLSSWVGSDVPTRAELYCNMSDANCREASRILQQKGVPTMNVASYDNSVALVYERILARDCNPRFVDNAHTNYNENHPAFGCSLSANIVQHVSDKKVFVAPNLTDPSRANTAVNAYDRAMMPNTDMRQDYSIDQSIVGAAKTQ